MRKIPAAIVDLVSKIFACHYFDTEYIQLIFKEELFFLEEDFSTYTRIDNGVRVFIFKMWFRQVNKNAKDPIATLGRLLEDFMDKESYFAEEYRLEEDQKRISQTLLKDGLIYSRGGNIRDSTTIIMSSLRQKSHAAKMRAVEKEIQRAIANIEEDPMVAVHNASCTLEAMCKNYLDHHAVTYKTETDTLSDLWRKVVEHIGIRPGEMNDKESKKIASGLFQIVEGTMYLRNKKGAAHGKSEIQLKKHSPIRPRHARLVVHAVCTLSLYILEFIETEDGQ